MRPSLPDLRLVSRRTEGATACVPLTGAEKRDPAQGPVVGRAAALFGAMEGVGKTNVGLNLAAALARLCRVLLLEVDRGRGDVEALVVERPQARFDEVARGHATLDAVCASGPFGLRMITRSSGLEPFASSSEGKGEVIQRGLQDWRPGFARTLILAPPMRTPGFWQAADEAEDSIVVTTPTPAGVAEAYSLVRELTTHTPQRRFHLIFNFTRDEVAVRRSFVALRDGVEGRLGTEVRLLGCVPVDQSLAAVIRRRAWLLEEHPDSPASHAFEAMARALVYSGLDDHSPGPGRSVLQRFLSRPAA